VATPPFLWGASTSSYQVEGSLNGTGRGETIWDKFVEKNNLDNANYACNSYNQYKDDVKAIKSFNGNSYRFSIAWSRIFPNGSGAKNQDGIDYYHRLIDECILNNVTPVVCLYHWDLPQALEFDYGGWLCTNGEIQRDFTAYAKFCFETYGDRVKHWVTINEPQTIAVDCYEYDWYAPGVGTSNGISTAGKEYRAGHNLLLCHALAVKEYRDGHYDGQIGIVCNMDWSEPYTNSVTNIAAAERRNIFWGGWFWDPIFFGDYPAIMRSQCGVRLPSFTSEESILIKGSIDIFFLNTYSSTYAYDENYQSSVDDKGNKLVGWTYDSQTNTTGYNKDGIIMGAETESAWLLVVPWGVRKLLLWIQERYSFDGYGTGIGIYDSSHPLIKKKLPLMIAENGVDIKDQNELTPYSVAKNDNERITYYESYLDNIAAAVKIGGIDFEGYFPWSLLDNFEWSHAYTARFGLFYLECNTSSTIARKPKNSVYWYKEYIKNNPNGPKSSYVVNTSAWADPAPNAVDAWADPAPDADAAWSGGNIRGYYYWDQNYYNKPFTTKTPDTITNVDTDTDTLYCLDKVNNRKGFTQKSYPKNYTGKIVTETNFNAMFLFTQYTNYNDIARAPLILMYNKAIAYFSEHNINHFLIGLCFGSGVIPSSPPKDNEGDGFFTLGAKGSIASIYTALTPNNKPYMYEQSNGEYITIVGTGDYTYSTPAIAAQLAKPLALGQYNCINFDIELATNDSLLNNVSLSDFTNLFAYIKQLYPNMIIITGIGHSASYYIPAITNELIISDASDYISPILYTQMFGTTNEYTANDNLSWAHFMNHLKLNPKFQRYGLDYLLPSIYSGYPITLQDQTTILDTYDNGGTNHGRPPNLYDYQTSTSVDQIVTEDSTNQQGMEFYTKDEGAVSFFNALARQYSDINSSAHLGGFIQWSNYDSRPEDPPPV